MLELKLEAPNYFFIPLDNELLKVYNEGFSLGDIFKVKGHAIKTNADELLINTKLNKLKANIDKYMRGESQIKVGEFTKSRGVDLNGTYKLFPYRIFDNRFYYDSSLTNVRCTNLTKHEEIKENMYLNFTASVLNDSNKYSHVLVTSKTPEVSCFKGKGKIHTAPLYIYNDQDKIESNIKEE